MHEFLAFVEVLGTVVLVAVEERGALPESHPRCLVNSVEAPRRRVSGFSGWGRVQVRNRMERGGDSPSPARNQHFRIASLAGENLI